MTPMVRVGRCFEHHAHLEHISIEGHSSIEISSDERDVVETLPRSSQISNNAGVGHRWFSSEKQEAALSGLIWNDLSSQRDLRTISKAASKAVEAAIATVDHSDIRGSEPHNRDPSGGEN